MLEHWVLPGEVLWIVLHTSRVAQSQSLYWKKISSKYLNSKSIQWKIWSSSLLDLLQYKLAILDETMLTEHGGSLLQFYLS